MQVIELTKKRRNTFVYERNKRDVFAQLFGGGKKISPKQNNFKRGKTQGNVVLNGRQTSLILSGFDDYVYEYELGSWLSKTFKKIGNSVKKVVKKIKPIVKKIGRAAEKVGKVALKVAPIALNFIPGIGTALAAGLTAVTGAASKMVDARAQQKAESAAEAQYQQEQAAADAQYQQELLAQQQAEQAALLQQAQSGNIAANLLPGLTVPVTQQQVYEQQQQQYNQEALEYGKLKAAQSESLTEAEAQAVIAAQAEAAEKKKKIIIYAGIGAAALIGVILIAKKK